MQSFLANNTVNWNLMSLTGYRTLVILQALIEFPKSNDELNDYLFGNQYIKEKFSSDTLRIYINSLRAIGCDITSANKTNDRKYHLISHPFEYTITKNQAKSISKLYKTMYNKIDILQVIEFENLLKKIITLIKNQSIETILEDALILRNIDFNILNDLIAYCKSKTQIILLYNSPKNGNKKIEVITDKLEFKSDKLYLWCDNITHDEYSYLPLERILDILGIRMRKTEIIRTAVEKKVVYELYDKNNTYYPEKNEKILSNEENKIIIEYTYKNEFEAIQKFLSLGESCNIIKPHNLKQRILDKLKLMEQNYD